MLKKAIGNDFYIHNNDFSSPYNLTLTLSISRDRVKKNYFMKISIDRILKGRLKGLNKRLLLFKAVGMVGYSVTRKIKETRGLLLKNKYSRRQ